MVMTVFDGADDIVAHTHMIPYRFHSPGLKAPVWPEFIEDEIHGLGTFGQLMWGTAGNL